MKTTYHAHRQTLYATRGDITVSCPLPLTGCETDARGWLVRLGEVVQSLDDEIEGKRDLYSELVEGFESLNRHHL